jgi:putative Mn2+ efflux pump MntP
MLISEIIVIAFGLAIDAFAVSLGAGAVGRIGNHRGAVRLAFHFGLFQFLMPVIGWYVGFKIEPLVKNIDDWIVFSLLSYIGIKMILDSYKPVGEFRKDPSKGKQIGEEDGSYGGSCYYRDRNKNINFTLYASRVI